MNKKGLVVLFFVFCLMFLFNIFTPLLNDDYFVSFVWPMGGSINALPMNAKRIGSFLDLFESLKSYYLTWGGRIPGQSFITFFAWQGKIYFNILNAFMVVVLIAEIYWLSHEGKVTLDFNENYILWIFFSLWTFNIAFTESLLWLSGSCEYLWMMVILLAFLIPYIQNYYDNSLLRKDTVCLNISMFFLGILSGCSRETLICWIIMLLSYWLISCKRNHNLQYWKLVGYVGLCIGYCLLVFAPGNTVRYRFLQSIMDTNIFANNSLLTYKIVELGTTLFFHFILWYFVICFFLKYQKKFLRKTYVKHLSIIQFSALISFVSGISMFFIPSRAVRISFVSLVLILISITTIFRIREKEGINIISKNAQSLLKKVGLLYLVLTISISFYGNYFNWDYWNNIVKQLKKPENSNAEVIIKVIPPLTDQNQLWFFGSGLVHLTGLPIYDNGPMNNLISRYYGVKGIKVEKCK